MIELKQGQSTTIGILIADGYNMSNIDNVYLYINQTKFTPAIIDRMLRVEMSSKTTSVFIGTSTVRLIFDDKTFGRREYVLENIVWEATKARVYDDSVDLGYTVTYPITISDTAIEAGNVMYDYVKGSAGSLSSVTASVDSNVGTPEVTVTYDGENADFAFKNLKGDKGEQGEQGEKGDDAVLPANIVIDPNYVHTDNNYTTADKAKVAGAIQTETDPNVPAWAKEPTKPTYTASEVGAEPAKGANDNYVTDDEKTKLSNLSGTNTGDQDLSGLAPINHTHPYEPANSNIQISVKKVNTLTTDGGQLTGFVDPIAVNVSYNGVTRKITLTGDIRAAYKGIPMTEIIPSFVSGWQSEAHDITDGGYFLYFNGTNFVWSAVAWDFKQLMIASVYRDGVNFCLRECHGLMDWQSHQSNHDNIGTYLKSGADVSGFILNSDVVANRRPTVSQALVYDEDLPSILPELTNGLYSRLFLDGANNANLENDKTDIVEYTAGSRFRYNLFTGGVWTKATAANNQYAKVFLMAVPVTSDADCQKNRFIWIMPQTANATLTTIQNLTPANLSLGQISTALAEYVFVQEFIIRATASGWTIVSTAKLTGNKRFQITASGALATSHTALLDKNAEPAFQHLDTTTEKTTPIDADSFGLWDSVTSTFKRLSVANMLTWFRGIQHTFSQLITFSGGVKTDTLTKLNGSGSYVNEDGGTIWHNTKWFTNSGTFSSNGTTVTTTSGQLTSAMIGSKIGTGTDKRIITAVANGNSCTVNSAFSQNYSAVSEWGVWNKQQDGNNWYGFAGNQTIVSVDLNGNYIVSSIYSLFQRGEFNRIGMIGDYIGLALGSRIVATNSLGTGYQYTPDIGLIRDTNGGAWRVYDGVSTNNLRDIKLRSVQVADNTAAASITTVGMTRYRADANNSYTEMCMQTGASTYAWVIIKQNTW